MPEKMPDVLLTGDSPTNPMIPEDDNSDPVFNHEEVPGQDWVKVSMTQQLGDAMETLPLESYRLRVEWGRGA